MSVERWMGKVWYSHRIHYSENELTTIIYTHTCRTWIHFTNIRLSVKKKSKNICNLILPTWSTETSKTKYTVSGYVYMRPNYEEEQGNEQNKMQLCSYIWAWWKSGWCIKKGKEETLKLLKMFCFLNWVVKTWVFLLLFFFKISSLYYTCIKCFIIKDKKKKELIQ